MISVQACRNIDCRHLKNDLRDKKEYNDVRCVSVCDETGIEPRFMESCSEKIEGFL